MWGKASALVGKATDKKSSESLGVGAHHPTGSVAADGEGVHDDDKGKKKPTPGTPDKPSSPDASGEPEKNQIINNEEIQRLAIKDEDLTKLRESVPTSLSDDKREQDQLKKSSYRVRKFRPQQQPAKQTKKLVVARPAPPSAQLKPLDFSAPTGPRYAEDGRIIPYSLLGSVHDFVSEAVRRNDLRADSPFVLEAPEVETELDVKNYERPPSNLNELIPTAMNQENALMNWRKKMIERKRQQGYISNLLSKPHDRLLMNQDDKYRAVQEKRKVIDRAIPAYDYGKGYRIGSEFWSQSESFGDDIGGIKMTLTNTEKGFPVEFEHIGKPITLQHEIGAAATGQRRTADPRRTWHSSKYLRQRSQQLDRVMKELDPLTPDIDNLEVVGLETSKNSSRSEYVEYETSALYDVKEDQGKQNDPLAKYPDVISAPVIGPSIKFGDKPARWTGSSTEYEGKLGIEERVTFESKLNERMTSLLHIENDGTTAVYYEWQKKPKIPSFVDMRPDTVQRFYFNTGEGVILPGDTAKIPFVFKSPNSGIFTETWEFVTRPTVLGGASLQVVLRGVAMKDDSSVAEKIKLEKSLAKREADVTVKKIIDEILKGIQTPDRSPSPIDAYITEEEIFLRKNPGRFYDHETIMELQNIYLQLFAEEDRENKDWNLSLDELQMCVAAVPDEDAREELLSGLNTVVKRLSYPPLSPSQRNMHTVGYRLWQETIDNLVSCSMMIRGIMGLPEVIMTEAVQEPEPQTAAAVAQLKSEPKVLSAKSQGSQASSQGKSNERKGSKAGKKSVPKDGKEDKNKKGGKKDAKEKDANRPKSKDPKAKGGKTVSPTKDLQSTERESKTPSATRIVATDSLDPVTRRKYTEKMYSQVYDLIVEMLDKMTFAFDEASSDLNQSV